jgi:hypothetical protein
MTNGIVGTPEFWTTTVSQYLEVVNKGDIIVNPEFQRLHCWTRKQMQNLMYSITNRYPINQITLVRFRSDEKWSVLDGGHRTRSMKQFQEGEFALSKTDVRGMDLPTQYYNKR